MSGWLLVLEISIILVLVLANSLLAMAEIAIVSARKVRLKQFSDSGDRRARVALELANDPADFLATVQIGITLVGVLAGAFGGATLAKEIQAAVSTVGPLAPHAATIGVGVTYLSLVLGELTPKRIALGSPEQTSRAVAVPMRLLSVASAPAVRLLNLSADAVIRLLRVRPSPEPPVTPEEIKTLVAQGTEVGVFEEAEREMIQGVLRLDERRVAGMITPRAQIVWLDIEDSAEVIRTKIEEGRHSRFPVARGTIDNVLGVVWARDLLRQCLSKQEVSLQPLLRPPLFIHESLSALRALALLKQEGAHVALVTDEYGDIQGMLTHGDILGEVAGYIPSSGKAEEHEAVQRADGSWLLGGMLHIDRMKEIFAIRELPGEGKGTYNTVGGFVMSRLHSIPEPGQQFDWRGLRIEVLDMDGRRVDKVLVTRAEPDTLDEEPTPKG
jgi:putative hemolysin